MDKTHTLTVTPQNEYQLYIEYVVYRTSNSSVTTPTADNTPGGGKRDPNTVAIVSGMVGVVAIFVLAILRVFLWSRRRAINKARRRDF